MGAEQKMYPTAFIRKHVYELPEGAIFSTRDMLNYGRRGAVDQALYRLIKKFVIVRVARGLFMKCEGTVRKPCALEIAEAKARAFGRTIVTHGREVVKKLVGYPDNPSERLFATDGSTTSFLYGAIRIVLHRIAQRKSRLRNSPVGLTIRGLWTIGNGNVTPEILHQTVGQLGRDDRALLRRSIADMPQWLSEMMLR